MRSKPCSARSAEAYPFSPSTNRKPSFSASVRTGLKPAVRNAQARGWNVKGPLPADTLFYLAARGDYDIVVAMYHDQGHGPIKVLGLEAGVNITVGLPMVRTSVDHGTAFDIAGKGIADERSLIEALRQAADLAPR